MSTPANQFSSTFSSMPLLRQFFMLDIESGTMLRHEVRRDQHTGMTLTMVMGADLSSTAGRPATPRANGVKQHHGSSS